MWSKGFASAGASMRGIWIRRRAAPSGLALLFAVLSSSACGPISVAQEQQLGHQFENQIAREVIFVRDAPVNRYVDEIGQKVVGAFAPHEFKYQFYVIRDDQINAFAGPAGHIYIHTETILQARNVSELAGVIAHEVGHVALRHVANNYNRQRNAKIGTQMVTAAANILTGGTAGGLASLGGGLAAMAVLNTFGREAEMEADAFAVEVMPRAGYHPDGLVTFFELLMQQGGPQAPAFLSDHPTTGDRIRETQALIAELPNKRGLMRRDGGRLGIIQRRIELLTQSRRR